MMACIGVSRAQTEAHSCRPFFLVVSGWKRHQERLGRVLGWLPEQARVQAHSPASMTMKSVTSARQSRQRQELWVDASLLRSTSFVAPTIQFSRRLSKLALTSPTLDFGLD